MSFHSSQKNIPIDRLISLLTCACLGHFPSVVIAEESKDRPNVVVFLVDDMGLMDTSVPFLQDESGNAKSYPLNKLYRTPNMQRLARTGIRFSHFYAMSVCSPTRVSIMTGQNAARHHTTQWISPEANNRGRYGPPEWNWTGLKSRDFTLARCLQSNGYRTIHVGKGHFGPFDHEGADPTNLGFDVNIGGRAIGAPASYFGKDNFDRRKNQSGTQRAKDRRVPRLEKYHGTDTHLTEALTQEALEQITKRVESDQRFFLYLAHYAVHSPHQSDPRFADNYVNTDLPERGKAFATLIEGMDRSSC
ncbi:MAG: sulfatase-like hydrolase/transferase [Planctomycetota bacterium]